MTDTKEAATAYASNRPFNSFAQKRYYDTHFVGDCKAVNDNKAALAEQKARDIAYSEKFIPDEKEALKLLFPTCIDVEFVKEREDQFKGKDYIVTYTEPRTGAILKASVDAKRQKAGTCKYWRDKKVPELTFEILNNGGKFVSCLTDPEEKTDFYMFTFDDTANVYLIPFQVAHFVLSQPSTVAHWQTKTTGNGTVCVYPPVDEFLTAAFMTKHLPAWLLKRLSVNFAEAAALKNLREANDNRQRTANDNATEQRLLKTNE